jgi:uncharacterized protein (DUF58 family)
MSTPHVKIYEEEREINLTILVDVSGSSFFKTGIQDKRTFIANLTASLAFSAIENNDMVGVIFFSDKIEAVIPHAKSHKQIMRIIKAILTLEPTSKGSDINIALEYYLRLRKQRSVCFLVSDFKCDNYEKSVRITAAKHDLIGIQVFDPKEQEIPNLGLIPATDLETGRFMWLDTANVSVRNQYKNAFELQSKRFKDTFKKHGADLLQLNTQESYVRSLIKFFLKRAK